MNEPSAGPGGNTIHWSGCSHIGRVRKNNEDSFLGIRFNAQEVYRLGKTGAASIETTDYVFAVSDGMGGAMAGELASRIAVEKITTILPRAFKQSAVGLDAGFSDVMAELFEQIHKALVYVGQSYEECTGMQTTLSLCWFTPGWMYFGHIGDSRIYHLPGRDQGIHQLSHDDTHVGWLLRNGKINEREARTHPRRNMLQKALGGGNQFVDPQVGAVGCEKGDMFLLCSDGLYEGLRDERLLEGLRVDGEPAFRPGVAEALVSKAVELSGKDNTTALVVGVS